MEEGKDVLVLSLDQEPVLPFRYSFAPKETRSLPTAPAPLQCALPTQLESQSYNTVPATFTFRETHCAEWGILSCGFSLREGQQDIHAKPQRLHIVRFV